MKLCNGDAPETGQTRRTFLQNVSFGLGAAAFTRLTPGTTANVQGKRSRKQDSLGIALVGLGSYATNQLAPALQKTERCHLAGIVTGTPSKAEAWAAKYNIPSRNVYNYDSFDQMADNPEIDIVYVVLPNSMHAAYSIRAARAGKHVICEKPMAVTVAECEAMIAACRQADRRLSIGYRLHFEPHNREAMRLGQEQVFGPVKLVETSFGFRIGDPTQWRLKKELAGGGALMDVGIYAIQAARYVTGEEPVSVVAREFKTDPQKFSEVDETILWQLTFPSGAAANSSTTYAAYVERLYATAPDGWFELGPAYSYSGIRGQTVNGPMEIEPINQQSAHMDAFADAIMNKKPISASGEEGLRDMKIIEAIYKSIDTGAIVDLT